MRWIFFSILVLLVLAIQVSLVQLIAFPAGAAGKVQPDLLAIVAVFVALFARADLDAMLAAMVLGLAADLTAGHLTSGFSVGIMPVAYALASGAVFRIRDAFFRESIPARLGLALVFCLIAHLLWVSGQSLLAWRTMSLAAYGHVVLQAVLLSLYTAAVAPPILWALSKAQGLLWVSPAARSRR